MGDKENHSDREEEDFDLDAAAAKVTLDLLPQKSQALYRKTYITYKTWCTERKLEETNESVLLVYFNYLSETLNYKSSTLWNRYSMLRTMIDTSEEKDISKYMKLRCFLKRKGDNYEPVKSKVFTDEELERFLKQASDEAFLGTKAIVVIAISGGCRTVELLQLEVEHITEEGNLLQVRIVDSKTKKGKRTFAMGGTFRDIVKKYWALRPKDVPTSRFFINYQRGKCTRQVMGKHKLSSAPKTIAEYLNLPEPERYTGHSFRRTSTTFLADAGADLVTIKQHGGWGSSSIAEGYIDKSLHKQTKIANIFNDTLNLNQPSSSTLPSNNHQNKTPDCEELSNILTQEEINEMFEEDWNLDETRPPLKKPKMTKQGPPKGSGPATMIIRDHCTVNIYYN